MTTIDTTVTRDGNWWVAEFTLNGKEYGTQARRLDQIEEMVKDAAALITGDSLDSFAVNVTVDTPEFAEDIKKYKEASLRLVQAEHETRDASRLAVARLRDAGFSLRDIGVVMGISYQRVAQLCA
ncbi:MULTISPECIES: hypothetical protein [Actinotignum]|uniref:Transcriptional regulator n=2 Tax=Actinotignum TaxID=1653174 RepID=A0AAW9HLI5_9ACTO|nr:MULTISPECIES: hypothetical protein [Actinotignum]MBS5748090.1 hypothetical protein [Actinotignum schaalii]MDE1559183.1 hypothetical protein [Actinotignum schaalii]MDE1664194.1 hypothetical protein [Actinotignum schaalii]MDK6372523.1 hypothetical protein [Actinotignum timonense]MDK6418832.1 hypothetical protein [Actinotignum timonense]